MPFVLTSDHDSPAHSRDSLWEDARWRLIQAFQADLQNEAVAMLADRKVGGCGLRAWLRRIVVEGSPLPSSLPHVLARVYLDNPNAMPLFDCARCGVALPVEAHLGNGESTPDRVFFERCPCCGGKVGLFAFWTSREEGTVFARNGRAIPRKPR